MYTVKRGACCGDGPTLHFLSVQSFPLLFWLSKLKINCFAPLLLFILSFSNIADKSKEKKLFGKSSNNPLQEFSHESVDTKLEQSEKWILDLNLHTAQKHNSKWILMLYLSSSNIKVWI